MGRMRSFSGLPVDDPWSVVYIPEPLESIHILGLTNPDAHVFFGLIRSGQHEDNITLTHDLLIFFSIERLLISQDMVTLRVL